MNDTDILKAIDKYNLSVRRIPDAVYRKMDFRYYEEGDDTELLTVDQVTYKESFARNYPNGRRFCIKKNIPDNAGKYMCKPVGNTDSRVKWNLKTDNLADTLAESVALFLKGVKYEEESETESIR